MTYTGEWETVGDPKHLTERQAVPDGWLVRVWAMNVVDDNVYTQIAGVAGNPIAVGVSMTFVRDVGHHWKIEKREEQGTA